MGIAFLPFGVWWFRVVVLAADASCVAYAVRVRPMLRLARVLDDDVQPDHHDGAATSIYRIEAHPADRSLKSRMMSSLDLFGFLADSDRRQARVVAVNGRGEERVLFVKATWEEALEARDRVHDDLLRLSLERWRGRYGVPGDFLD
ncbi:MAG: hypothetical protein M3137_00170 [Actinomycetota bacterium]|nr:hypothetical protein [Actinomycetota bacterium]